MDSASGLQSSGSERETWIDEEVETLLDVWGNTYIHVNRENLGKRHWETVVRDVNSRLAHQREQPQMKNKIDSLKKRYKREKAGKGENDRNSITWKWFDRCDLLWGPLKPEMASISAPELTMQRFVSFLNAMPPDVNVGQATKPAEAASRIADGHEERLPEGPPSCATCGRGTKVGDGDRGFHQTSNAGSVEPGKGDGVKRRKLLGGAPLTAQSLARIVQAFADTRSRVEQAKMEMSVALQGRRHEFLERMEERRLESEERHAERKLRMEERRLEVQQKLVQQKLEMEEKQMQRREALKLELLRLRLRVRGD